jgi:hypothetical protein
MLPQIERLLGPAAEELNQPLQVPLQGALIRACWRWTRGARRALTTCARTVQALLRFSGSALVRERSALGPSPVALGAERAGRAAACS